MTDWKPVTVEEAERLVRSAAWPDWSDADECPHCKGSGRDPQAKPRLVLHTRRSGLGADNDLETVVTDLKAAPMVLLRGGLFGSALAIPGPNSAIQVVIDL